MSALTLLADCFRYPAPGLAAALRSSAAALAEQPAALSLDQRTVRRVGSRVAAFLDQVEQLELGAWEELYTHTFDLTPPAAPYLGYQIWGDRYQRGEFLVDLVRVQREAGIDPRGELADHLVPCLEYLDRARPPLPRLLEVLPPALEKMQKGVRGLDRRSPYVPLLEGTLTVAERLSRAGAGEPDLREQGRTS